MSKKIFIAVILVAGLILGWGVDTKAQNTANPSLEGFSLEDAVINVANTTGKAVVSISTERTTRLSQQRRIYFNSPFGDDEAFRNFFDDFFGDLPQRDYKQVGLGSGVIIDADGYILTNEHVISGADKIKVTLSDGREFKAELKGGDLRSDLAVIKINAHNLPVAALGDSDNLKIGQWTVAIGNPFGFVMQNPEPTVTVGVISALHRCLGRTVSRERDYNDLIQTDAAINPGNSGGPLVNLKGEVVGINVAIFSTSGGYQGVGFAIPINNAKKVISKLIAGKKILYGWLGVTVQDLNDEMAKYFGLSAKSGVLVAHVLEGSPAQKAGIKESDIIRQFDEKAINNTKELITTVSNTEVGEKVKVAVIRDKKELILNVEIGERPQDLGKESAAKPAADAWRGLGVEELSQDLARRLNLAQIKGVVVVEVEPNSPADEAGITAADLILEINKQAVKSLADYQKITKAATGDCLVKTNRGYFIIKGE